MIEHHEVSEKELLATDRKESVFDAVHCRDWPCLRELSLRTGGFAEERTLAWPYLLHATSALASSEHEGQSEAPRKLRRRRKSTTRRGDEGNNLEQEARESLSQSIERHSDEHQIKLDTDRSFVLYPSESSKDREELQTELNNLITSVFRRHRRLSYFQGYHDIITVIFLTLPENDHLLCAEKISLHRLRDAMGSGLEPLMGLLQILKYLIRLIDPDYGALLERSTPLPYFALSNLLTLFSHDVPTLALIQHIFDYLLSRPPIAVVYLAAALTLRRKDEALELEREGEEGMLHSLLSSLPCLHDAGDNEDKASTGIPPADSVDCEDVASLENFEAQDLSSMINGNLADVPEPSKISPGGELSQESASNQEDNSDGVHQNAEIDGQSPESAVNDVGNPNAGFTGDDSQGDSSSLNEDSNLLSKSSPSRPSSPVSDASSNRTRSPRVALPVLLREADALFAQYPPSHPSLHVSSIFGPQSVIYTWSEDPNDLATDAEAEAMVTHPELIVLPFVDPDEQVGKETDEGTDSDASTSAGRARQHRRKLRKRRPQGHVRHFGVRLDKKTVLTGALVALGVGVAVYSIRAKSGVAGHGGGIYELVRSERPWRKAAQWISGAVIGGNEQLLASLGL